MVLAATGSAPSHAHSQVMKRSGRRLVKIDREPLSLIPVLPRSLGRLVWGARLDQNTDKPPNPAVTFKMADDDMFLKEGYQQLGKPLLELLTVASTLRVRSIASFERYDAANKAFSAINDKTQGLDLTACLEATTTYLRYKSRYFGEGHALLHRCKLSLGHRVA